MEIDWGGRSVETPELTINYARAGQGAPIVFLHGWPEFNRTWLHNMPVLADRYDCIAPDLRGFGRTISKVPRSESGTPPQLLAKDLKDFADALGLTRFAIVSHDVGSFVAQQFALAYPDSVSALFFFNCAYPGIGKRWGDFRHFPETWYQQFHQKELGGGAGGIVARSGAHLLSAISCGTGATRKRRSRRIWRSGSTTSCGRAICRAASIGTSASRAFARV